MRVVLDRLAKGVVVSAVLAGALASCTAAGTPRDGAPRDGGPQAAPEAAPAAPSLDRDEYVVSAAIAAAPKGALGRWHLKSLDGVEHATSDVSVSFESHGRVTLDIPGCGAVRTSLAFVDRVFRDADAAGEGSSRMAEKPPTVLPPADDIACAEPSDVDWPRLAPYVTDFETGTQVAVDGDELTTRTGAGTTTWTREEITLAGP